MSKTTDTTRRSFLKAGALVAAPAAAVGIPVAALAEDGSKAALARMQDERAIEALTHDFLRAFNRGGSTSTADMFAGRKAPAFAKEISRLNLDLAEQPAALTIAENGSSASARYLCNAELAEELQGQETIVQMARLQGNAAGLRSASKTLTAQYAKQAGGWVITSLELV